MGKLRNIAAIAIHGGLLLALCPAASAQPLAKPQKAAPAPAKLEEPAMAPSRYVGAEPEEYINKLAASFAITARANDVFGQPQDPEAKPIPKPSNHSSAQAADPGVPFQNMVPLIKITTIIPREKRFLVATATGIRVFNQGDQFPLPYHGRSYRVQVTEVSAGKVEFKNLDTGEIAAQNLNALPPGMSAGTGSLTAPGMVPANPNAPLEIESGSPNIAVPNR